MKDSLLTPRMYWSSLHALLSSICWDSIERNTLKNFWGCVVASCLFLILRQIGRVMSADTDASEVLRSQTHAEARPVDDA